MLDVGTVEYLPMKLYRITNHPDVTLVEKTNKTTEFTRLMSPYQIRVMCKPLIPKRENTQN